jgi:solute carrier family 25 carnitine/acylcarnitine transporter 20/29
MCHSSKPAATAKLQSKKLKVKNIQSSSEHSVRISYISGLVGGFCGAYVGQPFDTVKVRLQVAPKVYNSSIRKCCSEILKKEGVLSFWKGVTAPLLGMVMINGIVFGVEGQVFKHFEPTDDRSKQIQQHFYAGGVAGLAQTMVCCPTELIKCRMQIQNMSTDPKAVRYDNVVDAGVKIVKAEGPRALMNGFWSTVAREVPSFATYFATFYYLETHPSPYISFKTPTTPEEILSIDMLKLSMAGGTAGCTCWISSYPADVIKSRLQTDGFSSKPLYKGSIDCIKKSYKAEGLSWMFKGLGPTLFRAFPTNAATFSVTLVTMNMLSKFQKEP